MCGRFGLFARLDTIEDYFDAEFTFEHDGPLPGGSLKRSQSVRKQGNEIEHSDGISTMSDSPSVLP